MIDQVRSSCPYCGVGCGVIVSSQGSGAARRVIEVRGDPDHPANYGRLCTKGSTLLATQRTELVAPARLAHPQLRDSRNAPRRRIGWDEALDAAAARFADCIERHGPDSVAFYISGQLLTEDYYAFNKLARAVVGTHNLDSNSRLCMSSAVAGYKRTLGSDAPPACYEDLGLADCLFIAGSNLAWAHPVLCRRIEDARRDRPQMKIIVVDPRRTETAEMADLHLPILPGTDVALFHAMLHVMLWEGWIARDWVEAHTTGFDALRATVRECTPAWAADICGVPAESIVTAARWFATGGPTLSLYCQGLNQSSSGTAKNAALISLHLATGQIGRPGAGPLSLTGQPNAMGGRETGSMANLLPGHRDPSDAAHREEVARFWGVEALPSTPGRTGVEMFEAIGRGEIRCVWIACTNPVQSLPDGDAVRAALDRAEFVVLQEAYANTATAPFADLLLPASTWPEKDGTVTNSERRITRVRAACPPPGEARADWAIAADFARRLQSRLQTGEGSMARFDWPDAEAVWTEYRELTVGRDLDIGGLSWVVLERDGPQQWPYPAGASSGRARLYEDGRFATADGRARLASEPFKGVAEPVDSHFPMRLLTGRTRDAWHGQSRTGLIPQLFAHDPEPAILMAPRDLERRGLVAGDLLRVRSRRGQVMLPAQASDALRAGQVFVSMHWGPEYLEGGVNRLTLPALDPHSRQPELKHAAVSLERAVLPYRLTAIGWLAPDRLSDAQRDLRACFPVAGYGSCVPFGRDRCGLVLRLASATPFDAGLPGAIAQAFARSPQALSRYEDPRRQTLRWLGVDERRLSFMLIGSGDLAVSPADVRAQTYLHGLLLEATPLSSMASLLRPDAGANDDTAAAVPIARTVCSCLGVTDRQIAGFIERTGERSLSAVQSALSCGTGCGSCVAEVKRLIAIESVSYTHG